MTNEHQASAEDNQANNKLIHLDGDGDGAKANRAHDINKKN